MREFKLDFAYRLEARLTYDGLTPIQQSDIDRRVEFLCEHPEPDDESTFAWLEEGPDMFIFYDDAWLLIYALVDDGRVVEIWSITPAGHLTTES